MPGPGFTLDAESVVAIRELIRAEGTRVGGTSPHRRRRHEQANGSTTVPVKITAGGPGLNYVVSVYDNGYYDVNLAVNTPTQTGKVLKVYQLNAAATIPSGEVIDATYRNGHYEGNFASRWL